MGVKLGKVRKIFNLVAFRFQIAYSQRMRQRVTLTGFFFTLATVSVGMAAFASANNMLFLLMAALLATFLISGFISRLGLAGLELDIQPPEHVAARRPVRAELVLKNKKKWMPTFSIHLSGSASGLVTDVYVPVLPGGATLREPVDLQFTRRGLYRDNIFYFTSQFPFGFTQRRDMVRLEREIVVYPPVDGNGPLEELLGQVQGEVEARQRGRSADFYRVRPYEPLESARHVDWKATAHTGKLQVREFAREQDQRITIVLDLDWNTKESALFEHAIECCAFLVWRVANTDTRLRFITQRFDRQIPEEATAYTILKYLALVEPVSGIAPPESNANDGFQILVSSRSKGLLEGGWSPNRVLDVASFFAAGAESGDAGARHSVSG